MYGMYAEELYRLAVVRTCNRQDAEDIVQEAFLRLLKERGSFEDDEHIKAWLIRTVINTSVSFFRRMRTAEKKSGILEENGSYTEAYDGSRSDILSAVMELSEKKVRLI